MAAGKQSLHPLPPAFFPPTQESAARARMPNDQIELWLLTSRQSVGDQLGSERQPTGDRSATGWRLYLRRLFLIAESLEIGRQPIGDWSAISWRLKIVPGLSATTATGRRSVANQSATSRQPVGDHKKLFFDRVGRREVSLAEPKPPHDQIVPATFCNSRRPPCNRPATSLQPPENLVARRSPTGRKLCVTGVLLKLNCPKVILESKSDVLNIFSIIYFNFTKTVLKNSSYSSSY